MFDLTRLLLYLAALVCLCLPSASHAQQAITLKQAYEATLHQSEALKLTESTIEAAQIRYRQAIAEALPNLSLTASERVRSNTNRSNDSSFVGDSGGGTPFTGSGNERFQSAFTVSAPVFNGFREFILADAAESEERAARYATQRERELLLLDVADVFYQALMYEKDLEVLAKTKEILDQRVNELNSFRALGKSRDSEVQAAQADTAALLAAQEGTRGLLAETKELLAFLTGIPAAQLKLHESAPFASEAPLDELVQRGKERADIKASQERLVATQKQVTAARRERWPSLSLGANTYLYEDPDEDREWDVALTMRLPVFDGGRITERVNAQELESRRAGLRNQETQRIAERDIRTTYSNLQAARATVQRLERYVQDSEKSYYSQRADYEKDLVTNIAVLESIRQLQNARKELIDARMGVLRRRVALEVASGAATL